MGWCEKSGFVIFSAAAFCKIQTIEAGVHSSSIRLLFLVVVFSYAYAGEVLHRTAIGKLAVTFHGTNGTNYVNTMPH